MHEPPSANSSRYQPRPTWLGQQRLIIRVFRCRKVNKPKAKEGRRAAHEKGPTRNASVRERSQKGVGPTTRDPYRQASAHTRKDTGPNHAERRGRVRQSTTQLSGRRRLRPGYSDSPRSHRPVLPPSFLSRRISEISIPRSTALHMSYTVRHATLAAVRASISMPVLPVTPVVVVT